MTESLIAGVLPPGVESAEAYGDRAEPLFPAEEAHVATTGEERRREFTTGRALARAALAGLGHAPTEIRSGARGAPIWPAGVVGSITHCAGYRAAAVGPAHTLAAIGIDAEPNEALPDGVLAVVATGGEQRALADLAVRRAGIAWDRLLFSAKESAYKTWWPLTGEWLEFEQVEVSFAIDEDTVTALVNGTGPVHGRWARHGGWLVTAIVVPSAQG